MLEMCFDQRLAKIYKIKSNQRDKDIVLKGEQNDKIKSQLT
jgi:hypothetical protein